MTHTYHITGMTCESCVAKVKGRLLMLGDVTEATVQLAAPQATITMQKHIPLAVLQTAVAAAGPYTITQTEGAVHSAEAVAEGPSGPATYRPILLIGAYITGITLLLQAVKGGFVLESWMPDFMAGFFLVFSFFKLLDLKGFAESYATYDIMARRWRGWGRVYPFVELFLGLAFLLRFQPVLTNAITFVVMSTAIIGVLQTVLNKRKIRCACLGAVFNLPMSTITVTEDALMIGMSAVMMVTMT